MQYRVALMPKYRNRPGYALKPTSITVHNTANPNATAANHVAFLNAQARSASWHICVDDIEAVLQIPLNEQAWHAGTNAGNTTSIGIEVCEFTDPARQAKAEANAQQLIGSMLDGSAPVGFVCRVGIENVRTHQSWSGKYCPRVILPHWAAFVSGITSSPQGGGTDMLRLLDPVPAGRQQFYRLYHPAREHFWTADIAEANKVLASDEAWQFEGPAWWLSTTDPNNTLPIYRVARTNGKHFYTTSASEKDTQVAAGGKSEGIVGYAGTRGAPVYRFEVGGGHFYTTSEAEGAGMKPNGIAWYCGHDVAPTPSDTNEQIAALDAKLDKTADLARQILAVTA